MTQAAETAPLPDEALPFFASEPFLRALADVYFPGRPWAVVDAAVGGQRLRLLEVDRKRLVHRMPFLDFHVPLGPAGPGLERQLPRVQRALRGVVPVEAWKGGQPSSRAAPLIDWSRFPTWEAFEAFVRASRSNATRDARRRARKLERELGSLEFVFDEPNLEDVELCLLWKSRQYARTGHVDHLARAENAELFWLLAERGLLTTSVLRAGGRPVAIHLGVVWGGRFLYWVPAFDDALSAYSPGRLLLNEMLAHSFAAGHRTFDFLLGDETYKLHYATHVQLVGELGAPALASRVWRALRARVSSSLRHHAPVGWGLARRTKRYLKDRGLL